MLLSKKKLKQILKFCFNHLINILILSNII